MDLIIIGFGIATLMFIALVVIGLLAMRGDEKMQRILYVFFLIYTLYCVLMMSVMVVYAFVQYTG